jgi:hypothetical protein
MTAEIDEAYDSSVRKWAANLSEPSSLIGKVRTGDALINRISETIDTTNKIDKIIICAPYYDEKGEAILAFVEKLNPTQVDILIQNDRSTLYPSALKNMPENVSVFPVEFRRSQEGDIERRRFIHAKFFAIKQNEVVSVYVGSANCSQAALTITGSAGNAELMAIQKLTYQEFQERYLDEIEILEEKVSLQEPSEKDEPSMQNGDAIRLQAARYESPTVTVAYNCAPAVILRKAIINDISYDIEIVETGVGVVTVLGQEPRTLHIEGTLNGQLIQSNSLWIDHERELRSTARGRTFVEIVRGRVRNDQWGIGAWTDIMDVFLKHLQYMPPKILLPRQINI